VELWRSDGTAGGTVQVKNIHPGAGDSSPEFLTDVGGSLFFTADDGLHGQELWTSDGTGAGTVEVKNIRRGARGSFPYSLTDVAGTLFFTAADRTHGRELWTSDGSGAGTVQVKDVNALVGFRVARRGEHNFRKGTVRVGVRVGAAGRLVVTPARDDLVRRTVQQVTSAGATTVVLTPTRAGTRILKRNGTLRVRARFTFTPCAGAGSSVVRRYQLALR
jgi:ELWxxDGT repeat protein